MLELSVQIVQRIIYYNSCHARVGLPLSKHKVDFDAIGCQFHLNGCRARQQITLRTVEGGQSRRIKKDLGSLVFL